ncbi:cyclin-domain-containing protein [Geranomyces variabilis]|nr:cyclin-domain-containing protein [Geranomyces variabilis]
MARSPTRENPSSPHAAGMYRLAQLLLPVHSRPLFPPLRLASPSPPWAMPPTFDLAATPVAKTASLVAAHLAKVTAANDKKPGKHGLTRFHARTKPSIDLLGYANRIMKYAPCANECFLAVLIYLERMEVPARRFLSGGFADNASRKRALVAPPASRQNAPATLGSGAVLVDSYNVHRLLITGIMVAVKFHSDVFFTNLHYARVGGLPVHELNELEMEFLLSNGFDLIISVEELQFVGNQLLALENEALVSPPPSPATPRSLLHAASLAVGSSPHETPKISAPTLPPSRGPSPMGDERINSVPATRSADSRTSDDSVVDGHCKAVTYQYSNAEAEIDGVPAARSATETVPGRPPCLEPRYVSDCFTNLTRRFDVRQSLCVQKKDPLRSIDVMVTDDGHTLVRTRDSHHEAAAATAAEHSLLFRPYSRPPVSSRSHRQPYSASTALPAVFSPSSVHSSSPNTYQSPPRSPPSTSRLPQHHGSVYESLPPNLPPSSPRKCSKRDERRAKIAIARYPLAHHSPQQLTSPPSDSPPAAPPGDLWVRVDLPFAYPPPPARGSWCQIDETCCDDDEEDDAAEP